MINRIEALVDAIGKLNGAFDPGDANNPNPAYVLRNPLLIRSFASKAGKHECDEQGHRIFHSLISGYKAAEFDLKVKISGNSRAGLKPDHCLWNLLGVYGITEPGGISAVVSFLRRALKEPQLSRDTPLRFFLEALTTGSSGGQTTTAGRSRPRPE